MLSPYKIDRDTRRIHFDITASGETLGATLEYDSNIDPNPHVAELPIESYNGKTAVAFVPDLVKSFPYGLYWLVIRSGCNECGRCPVQIESCVVSNFRQEKEQYCGDIQRECKPCPAPCPTDSGCDAPQVNIVRKIDAKLC